jgi:hypothetical protein
MLRHIGCVDAVAGGTNRRSIASMRSLTSRGVMRRASAIPLTGGSTRCIAAIARSGGSRGGQDAPAGDEVEALVAGTGVARRADCPQQFRRALVLANRDGHAGERGRHGELVAAQGCVQHHAQGDLERREPGGEREPVPSGVVQIEHEHVRACRAQQGPELLLARRVADVAKV